MRQVRPPDDWRVLERERQQMQQVFRVTFGNPCDHMKREEPKNNRWVPPRGYNKPWKLRHR